MTMTAKRYILLEAALFCICLVGFGAFAVQAQATVLSVTINDNLIYSSSPGMRTTEVDGAIYDSSSMTLTLQNLSVNTSSYGVLISGESEDTVKVVLKGTNAVTGTTEYASGINSTTQLQLSGSKLTTSGCWCGIRGESVTINSGTYNLANCADCGIAGDKFIKLKGGRCNITTKTPASNWALYSTSGKISNKPARLGTIKGQLGRGARFINAKSTYKVTMSGSDLTLQKYASTKRKAKVGKQVYGGATYSVTSIAAKAFKNAKGSKVKRIVLGSSVEDIGKQAFAGTKRLTTLDLSGLYDTSRQGTTSGFHKKAFSKCGKKNGKSLIVKCGQSSKSAQTAFKKALVSKGLSKKAKVKA